MTPFLESVSERYRGFALTKILPIRELNCTLRELIHEQTGALVIHLESDDPENLFCLSLRTLPSSSNGVAHILEHTVLCGSRKYPVKDPFFAMGRRSLNTFMNAMTGSDFTCYPAATQVEKDFYNLLDVYLDAVFHPQLKDVSFFQEGCRLEFSEPANPKSPLEFKGIVFNEMKGSLSSADSRLWYGMMAALFPDLTYAHNSGGDPKVIPRLTFGELVAFHDIYYHPSRCLFFFYGNLPLKKHLDFLEENALKNVRKLPPQPPIPRQRRFLTPTYKEMGYPINEGEDLKNKSMIAFGWATAHLLDQEEVLALSVLDSILMDTDASPLKLVLLKSGLCIQADAFMDTEMSEVPYMIVCKGCEKENGDALEKFLLAALKEIAAKGIPAPLIETAIHQLEFSRTEIVGDSSPFGLTLFLRSGLAKQHGCEPENALTLHSLFNKLIEKTKDPQYFPSLIKKHLLDNPHRVRLTLFPDPLLAAKENKEEKNTLEAIQSKLSQAEIAAILKQTEKLAKYQQETENQNIDVLPKVGLEDVPLLVHDFPLKTENLGELSLFHHPCFTNQIVYADLIFDLPDIAEEDLPFLQLFASFLTEVGAGKRDYLANLDFMQAHTGGIGAAVNLHVHLDSSAGMKPTLSVRGKALYRKADKLFTLLKETVASPRFDEKERIEELILQLNTSLQNRFTRNALRYAMQLALSGFSVAGHINNLSHGLPFFKKVQELAQNSAKNLDQIIEKFLYFKEHLLCLKSPHLVLSCDENMYGTLKKEKFYGLTELPARPFKTWTGKYPVPPLTSQARAISSPLAFTVQAYHAVGYFHPHAPALSAAMPIFENKILHPRIREQGGAYGSGASYSASLDNFYLYAYRDPHIASTLETFRKSIEEMALGRFQESDLEEAKLGVIQSMDQPIAPGSRAIAAYNSWRQGKTKERRQQFRNRLLALTKKETQHAIEKEILPKKNDGVTICFAGKELLEKEKVTLPLLGI